MHSYRFSRLRCVACAISKRSTASNNNDDSNDTTKENPELLETGFDGALHAERYWMVLRHICTSMKCK